MLIPPTSYNYNQSFGHKFKLSKNSIKASESSTGLSYHEMTHLSLEESLKLMNKRGKKKTSGFKLWLSSMYKSIGKKLGLLEKRYNIYTDID